MLVCGVSCQSFPLADVVRGAGLVPAQPVVAAPALQAASRLARGDYLHSIRVSNRLRQRVRLARCRQVVVQLTIDQMHVDRSSNCSTSRTPSPSAPRPSSVPLSTTMTSPGCAARGPSACLPSKSSTLRSARRRERRGGHAPSCASTCPPSRSTRWTLSRKSNRCAQPWRRLPHDLGRLRLA